MITFNFLDPCQINFTRIGGTCYYVKSEAGRELDWKAASKTCQRLGGHLAEMETIEESQDIIAFIQTNQHLRGKTFNNRSYQNCCYTYIN